MIVEQLQRLVDSGSMRAPNYFNGRLLTAGDLTQEREVGRELLTRVAQCVGAGVAFGFEVTKGFDRQVVRVRAGLALGPYGDPLQLNDNIDLNVIAAVAPAAAMNGMAGFRPCQPPAAGPTTVTNPGLHLLAVGPASGSSGLAVTSTLSSSAATCSLKDNVNGLRFVLLPFRLDLESQLRDDPSAAAGDAGLRSRFRSRAALACFGSGPTFPPTPGIAEQPTAAFGALATITDPALPACHVPLALLNITEGGIDFVDMWAARRGLAPPSASGFWGSWFSTQARGECEVLQFQDHLASLFRELRVSSGLSGARAKDYFEVLPSFGIVPIVNGSFAGFDATEFFAGRVSELFSTRHLAGVNGALSFLPRITPDAAAALIRQAMSIPAAPNVDGLFLQRYLIASGDELPAGPLQVLFTLRDTHGPIEDDDVAEVLRDAADAYSALLSRAVLTPRPLTPASLVGWSALQALQLAVIQSATLDGASAALRGLDQRAVVAAFRRLLQVQESLVAGALLELPDDKNQNDRRSRATRLDELLHGPLGSGNLALKPSLDVNPTLIPKVLIAQNEINKEVRNWTADVAVGTIVVGLAALDSATIVPGSDKTYRFSLRVTNRATAPVQVQLTPTVVGPDGKAAPQWGTLKITDERQAGPITLLAVPRDGTARALALLKAPPAAAVPVDVRATIQVAGSVAFPSDLNAIASLDIIAGTVDVPASPRTLKLTEGGIEPHDEALAPRDRRACKFQLSCEGIVADVQPTFTATLKCVPATATSEWKVTITTGTPGGNPDPIRIADGQFQFSAPVTLRVNETANITIALVAPAAGAVKTCEFTVSAKLPAAGPALPEVVQSPPGNPTYSLKVLPA
jgi:hypothetical protein